MSDRPKTVSAAMAEARDRREGYSTAGPTQRARLKRMAGRGDQRARDVLARHDADHTDDTNEGDQA